MGKPTPKKMDLKTELTADSMDLHLEKQKQ